MYVKLQLRIQLGERDTPPPLPITQYMRLNPEKVDPKVDQTG